MKNLVVLLCFQILASYSLAQKTSCISERAIIFNKLHEIKLVKDSLLVIKKSTIKQKEITNSKIIRNKYNAFIDNLDSIKQPLDYFKKVYEIDSIKNKIDTIDIYFPTNAYLNFNSAYFDLVKLYLFSRTYKIFDEPIRKRNNINENIFVNILTIKDSITTLYIVTHGEKIYRKQFKGTYHINNSYKIDSVYYEESFYNRIKLLLDKTKLFERNSKNDSSFIDDCSDLILFEINYYGYFLLDFVNVSIIKNKKLKYLNEIKVQTEKLFN